MSGESPAPHSGFERRCAERIPVPPRGSAVSVVGARLVNISGYGMMIESLVPLERGTRMEFRLVVSGEQIDVEAHIAACKLLSSGKRRLFGVGCQFTSLPEPARERLIEALAPVAQPK